MAFVRVPSRNLELAEPERIREFLAPYGIWYERWPSESKAGPEASSEEILTAYGEEIERLKKRGGYVTADVVNLTPQTPNLEAMLDKFRKEHTHSEDEVRFIVKGRGVFHIHGSDGLVFSIETVASDLINVPAGTRHWFDLCNERTIRAIRLFKDTAGWAPSYIDNGVHAQHLPICLGPAFLPGERAKIPGMQVP
jgi:1,2-dihydroxy-3-keto-5-methylthiopentene dioxygenase